MRRIVILMVLLLCLTYSKNAIAQELPKIFREPVSTPVPEIQTIEKIQIPRVPTDTPTPTQIPTPVPTLTPTVTPFITPVPTPYPTYQPVLIITPRPTVYPTTSSSEKIEATESAKEEIFGTASAAIENYFPEEVIDDFWHMVKIITASSIMTLMLTKRVMRIKKRNLYKKSGMKKLLKKKKTEKEKTKSNNLFLSFPGIADLYELYCDSKDVWESRKEDE